MSWPFVFVVFAFFAAQHDCGNVAEAQPLSEDPKTMLVLAHAVQLESACPVDQAAILHVLARRHAMQRQGWTLAEQVRRYVPPLRRGPRTPRQRYIMWQTWARVPRAVKRLVERFAEGSLRNPCEGAVHWAAPRIRSPLRRVRCGTRNAFYAKP